MIRASHWRSGASLAMLAFMASGCGSRSTAWNQQQALVEVQQGDYVTAEARLNELYGSHRIGEPAKVGARLEKTPAWNEKHLLLWCMERGTIAQLRDDPTASSSFLDDAAYLIDYRRIVSFGREIGSVVGNDTLREYAGEHFEHTQVDHWRTVNHLTSAQRTEGLSRIPLGRRTAPTNSTMAPAKATGSSDDSYQRAVTVARRMTLGQMKEIQDAAGGQRYRDDPFARLLAASVVMAMPGSSRVEGDEQYADLMLTGSLSGYTEHHRLFTADASLRYEVATRPALAERMFLRQIRRADPSQFSQRAVAAGFAEGDPRLTAAEAPAGWGSVVVFDHRGFITRPETLDVRLIATSGLQLGSHRSDGTHFTIGSAWFFASGPGHEVASTWPLIPLPNDIARHLAPGGIAVMGLSLPAHRGDVAIAEPGTVSVSPLSGGSAVTAPMELLCDLDAYARATLKDKQPALMAKTIIRAVAKQVAVSGAAQAVKRTEGDVAGFLINLLGSALATASEVADVRAWTTLPDHITGALIDLPSGDHRLVLNGETLGEVTIRPGRLVVICTRTFPQPLLVPPSTR